MPRPLRPIDDHLVYHVINRGNNRAPVFHDDEDYAAFLRAIDDLKQRRPFAFYGYCLMPNHVHLLIRPLETPISRLMQSLLVSHTQRYHRCHRSGGHVWQGRFNADFHGWESPHNPRVIALAFPRIFKVRHDPV